MRPKLRLVGAQQIDRKLNRLNGLTAPSIEKRALYAGGEIIAEEARLLVHVRSGNLRDSIAVSDRMANAAWSGMKVRQGSMVVYVGPQRGSDPDGWYGHFEEFGTEHSPAHPFMRPAFDAKQAAAMDAIAGMLRVELTKLAA